MRSKLFSFLMLFTVLILVLTACNSESGSSQKQANDKTQKSAQVSDQSNANTPTKDNSKTNNDVKTNSDSTNSDKTNSDSMSKDKNMKTSEKGKKNDHILNVTAHDFSFNKEKYVVQGGKVTINFKSTQGTHGFALYKSDHDFDKIVNIIGDGTKTVKLSPGTYYIHCSVVCGLGHGDMDATLVVK